MKFNPRFKNEGDHISATYAKVDTENKASDEPKKCE
jgi:hypothetical protein